MLSFYIISVYKEIPTTALRSNLKQTFTLANSMIKKSYMKLVYLTT